MVAVACGCGVGVCAAVASASVAVAVGCNGVGLSTGFVIGVNGRSVVVSAGFAVAMRGTAVVVSLGTTVEIWFSSSSGFSSGSRDARFLTKTCGTGGCGLADVATVCACGIGFCAVMDSAGIGIAVAVCNGVVMAGCGVSMACCGTASACCGTASGSIDFRFLVTVCGIGVCGSATVLASCCCGTRFCAVMVSIGVAVAICNGMAMAGCAVVRFSRFLAVACGMAGGCLAMVFVACCCGAEICVALASAGIGIAVVCNGAGLSASFAIAVRGIAIVVCFGATAELWLARGSRISSGSRFSRFPAVACGIAGCVLAMVSVACCCGAGICATVVSAGISVGVAF